MSDKPLEDYSLPYLWKRIEELEAKVEPLQPFKEKILDLQAKLDAVKKVKTFGVEASSSSDGTYRVVQWAKWDDILEALQEVNEYDEDGGVSGWVRAAKEKSITREMRIQEDLHRLKLLEVTAKERAVQLISEIFEEIYETYDDNQAYWQRLRRHDLEQEEVLLDYIDKLENEG